MERYFNKINNFYTRLVLVFLYWICFICYHIVRGVNTDHFNTFGFIYACVIYIPLTLFILFDKFHISFILIIIMLGMEGITSFGTIIKYFKAINADKVLDISGFTLVSSVVSLIVSISLIVLGIIKMKRDVKETIYSKNLKIFILICVIFTFGKIGCSVYNLIQINSYVTNSSLIWENTLSMFYNTILFVLECLYIICAKKQEYFEESKQ